MSNFQKYGNLINGRWDYEGEQFEIHSPVDGSLVATAVKASKDKTNETVESSLASFRDGWGTTSPATRRKLLSKLAERIQERSEEYSRLETLNTGKTMRQSLLMDVPLAIEHIKYFASEDSFQFSREIKHPEFPGTSGTVQYAPLGVVAAIAPWNVPLLMAVWKLAPALLAGNTTVLKPSHYTPLTALELGRDSVEVGFPPGVINVITGDGHVVGDALALHRDVNMISFTGSTYTGRKLAQRAATSTSFKKITLELGGKSPNIVFSDADLEKAAKGVLFGIFLNSGQLCESGSRLLVQEEVKEKLIGKLQRLMSRMRPGSPLDMETDISAITTTEQRTKIEEMVDNGLGDGATVLFQRDLENRVPQDGLYFPPTMLGNISPDMTVAKEEIFGPVLSVMPFKTEEDAIQLANSSRYGLACGLWSGDLVRAQRVAGRMEAGTVWINEYHLLSAAAPRGGFKDSGIGRELGSDGIMEFTQTRHIFTNDEENDGGIDQVAYGLISPDS